MNPTYTRLDLDCIDISTPEGWEAYDTDAATQWLDTCDTEERAEYFQMMGIQIGEG